MNTNQDIIHHLIDVSTRQIEVAENRFLKLTSKQIEQASPQNGWSIGQCFAHLNTYSQHYIPLLEATIKKNRDGVPTAFGSGWLGKVFINTVKPENLRKYSAAKKHRPVPNVDGRAELDAFISYSKRLNACLLSSIEKDLNKNRIPISLAKVITMKLGDTYQFIIEHNQRHINQALKNLEIVTES